MKKNILIIESDFFEQEIFSKVFSDQFRIKFAVNTCDALDVTARFPPEVIVYDMGVPDAGALASLQETLRIEAKNFFRHNTPLILIVSDNSISFERTARELGVYYFLIKPFEFKELSEAIFSATNADDTRSAGRTHSNRNAS